MTATIHDFCEYRAKQRSKARHQLAEQALTARAAKVAFGTELMDKDFDEDSIYAAEIKAVAFNMASE